MLTPRTLATHLLPALALLGAALPTPAASAAVSATGDWTQAGFDSGHGGDNPLESVLTPASIAGLHETAAIGALGQPTGAVIVAAGVAYTSSGGTLASWDLASGLRRWSQPLPGSLIGGPVMGNGIVVAATALGAADG